MSTKSMAGPEWAIMRRFLTLGVGLLLVGAATAAVLSVRASASESPSSPLTFAGSGANLAITRILADAFTRAHPEIKISVPASIGSTGAIRAAAERAITIGLISRPLNEKEQGLGLTVIPYAKTAVVIGAHPSVVEDGITFEELVRIYKGEKLRWQDARGIVVLTREPGDSSIAALEREIPGFKEAYAESQQAKRWTTSYTDQEANKLLSKTPYAIGVSDMGTITSEKLPIKVLKVNGVFPTAENVLRGRYSLVKTLAFVFFQDKLPAEANAFKDFVRSKAGEKILKASGYVLGE